MLQRWWVRIPAPHTGWTFSHFICCKNCNVCLKIDENKSEKEAGDGPFLYLAPDLLVWLNPNQSNRRSAIPTVVLPITSKQLSRKLFSVKTMPMNCYECNKTPSCL